MIVRWLAYLVVLIVPAEKRDWAEAMRSEIWAIDGWWQGVGFALNCLLVALRLRKAAQDMADMRALASRSAQPFRAGLISGLVCAGLATVIGLAYLDMADAPLTLIASNVAAFTVGVLLLAGLYHSGGGLLSRYTALTVAGAISILLTAAFGRPVDGVARWIALGGVFIQTSLVLMPVAVVAFARATNGLSATAMSVMAVGLALQPDRAVAGALFLALFAVVLRKGGVTTIVPALIAFAAFVAALVKPDALPAVPYVDLILWSAFRIHPFLGVAMWAGCAVLLYPALAGNGADRAAKDGFFVVWAAIIAAAAIDAYPTPFVGYGAAAIIGYVLSLFALYPSEQPHKGSVDAFGIDNFPADSGTWFYVVPEPVRDGSAQHTVTPC